MTITVEERVYLDAEGQATTDEEKGNVLWATPGTEVSEDAAEEVGYEPSEKAPTEDPGEKSVKAPKGTKVVEGPGGDK